MKNHKKTTPLQALRYLLSFLVVICVALGVTVNIEKLSALELFVFYLIDLSIIGFLIISTAKVDYYIFNQELNRKLAKCKNG